MTKKAAVKNILFEIPITLSMVVGDIVIRFGALERVIFTALARVQSTDEGRSGDTERFLELVGEYKKIKTLGKLIEKAQKYFETRNFDWIDFDALKNLKDQRNAIHDALVEEPDRKKTWQASSDRKHRAVNYAELLLLRDATERTIIQINDGSLDYKRTSNETKTEQ